MSDSPLWRRLQPVVATLLVLTVIGIPLWLVVATAAKSRGEALTPNLSPPSHWHLLENLGAVWTDAKVPTAFFGSLLVVVPTVFGVLAFGSMAAWVLARRATRLTAFLYAFGISGIVLPPAVVTIVLLLRQLGLAGTAVGMIGVYMGIYMSTVIFFVTGFVRTIPTWRRSTARARSRCSGGWCCRCSGRSSPPPRSSSACTCGTTCSTRSSSSEAALTRCRSTFSASRVRGST